MNVSQLKLVSTELENLILYQHLWVKRPSQIDNLYGMHASQKVTKTCKCFLRLNKYWYSSAKTEGSLTIRLTH
jgi:Family of unknown function (DUF6467)